MSPQTASGRAMLRHPLYRHAVGHVTAIEREAQALVLDALEAAVGAIQPVTQSGERYSAGFRAGVADAKAEFLEAIQQQRSKP